MSADVSRACRPAFHGPRRDRETSAAAGPRGNRQTPHAHRARQNSGGGHRERHSARRRCGGFYWGTLPAESSQLTARAERHDFYLRIDCFSRLANPSTHPLAALFLVGHPAKHSPVRVPRRIGSCQPHPLCDARRLTLPRSRSPSSVVHRSRSFRSPVARAARVVHRAGLRFRTYTEETNHVCLRRPEPQRFATRVAW